MAPVRTVHLSGRGAAHLGSGGRGIWRSQPASLQYRKLWANLTYASLFLKMKTNKRTYCMELGVVYLHFGVRRKDGENLTYNWRGEQEVESDELSNGYSQGLTQCV